MGDNSAKGTSWRRTADRYERMAGGSAMAAQPPAWTEMSSLPTSTGVTRPRLLNKEHQHTGIDRFGMPLRNALLYWSDLFHTLLNMPRYRFIAIFFTIYVLEYIVFALLYLSLPDECIEGISHFPSALWFSVQTAATIGYGGRLSPSPDCASINVLVMFQSIFSSLVDYCMMGLVFARFSAPLKRSLSVRFSSSMVVYRQESGPWCLGFRVANMRKHIMIKPEVQVLLALPDNPGQSAFVFQELALQQHVSHMANLRLGLAATVVHVIDSSSPLWQLSLEELFQREMEIVVFLDATDAMTSNCLQARHSYYPGDLRLGQRFATLYMMHKGQRLGLDFSEFDNTVSAGPALLPPDLLRTSSFQTLAAAAAAAPEACGGGAGGSSSDGRGRGSSSSLVVQVHAQGGTPTAGAAAAWAGSSAAGHGGDAAAVAGVGGELLQPGQSPKARQQQQHWGDGSAAAGAACSSSSSSRQVASPKASLVTRLQRSTGAVGSARLDSFGPGDLELLRSSSSGGGAERLKSAATRRTVGPGKGQEAGTTGTIRQTASSSQLE